MILFLANIPTVICAGLASFLWYEGIPHGPGWLIFLAVILMVSPKSDEKEKS